MPSIRKNKVLIFIIIDKLETKKNNATSRKKIKKLRHQIDTTSQIHNLKELISENSLLN